MTAMHGAGTPGVKMEADSEMGNGWIKAEAETSSAMQMDEDIYEDAGDLDFAAASQDLYLTRLPKMLWDSWSQLDNEQEIRLGTVRVEGSLNEVKRMSLMLAPDVASRAILPREYVLDITNPDTINTFVFSEKDLPGYTSKLHDNMKLNGGSTVPLSQRSILQDRPRIGPQGIDKSRKGQGRRGIPKQTAIKGRIQKELQCLPVDNEEFRRVMEDRAMREKEKKTTSFEYGALSTSIDSTRQGAGDSFATFIKTGKPGKKSQKLKAARMPVNELMEEIFRCFKRYEYWSLKNLVREIRQPEVFLKQNLERVAHLIKSGRFSGQWQLKPDSKHEEGFDNVKSEQAPEVASPKVSDVEFEDGEEE